MPVPPDVRLDRKIEQPMVPEVNRRADGQHEPAERTARWSKVNAAQPQRQLSAKTEECQAESAATIAAPAFVIPPRHKDRAAKQDQQ